MCFHLVIRRYKGGVEYIVDLPGGGKVESVYKGR